MSETEYTIPMRKPSDATQDSPSRGWRKKRKQRLQTHLGYLVVIFLVRLRLLAGELTTNLTRSQMLLLNCFSQNSSGKVRIDHQFAIRGQPQVGWRRFIS